VRRVRPVVAGQRLDPRDPRADVAVDLGQREQPELLRAGIGADAGPDYQPQRRKPREVRGRRQIADQPRPAGEPGVELRELGGGLAERLVDLRRARLVAGP
jgi:hypothetical protein